MKDDLRIAIRRQPRGWHRSPCYIAGCGRAATRGHLCALCQDEAAQFVAEQIGIEIDRIEVNLEGYILVRRLGEKQMTLAHRAVFERQLGRKLLPGENVHHKNGNRADNRRENLELWVTAQPSGQRPEDLVEYAEMIISRYGSGAK